MANYDNFEPKNEGKVVQQYNNLSKIIAEKIREVREEVRVPIIKSLNLTNLQLINLFLQAEKKEDYETLTVAKFLLQERGFGIPC